ncbi:MAG: ferritin [Armatimonadota bacterium]
MALSEQMARKLNDQVTAEFYSAYYYLGMAVAFNAMGLKVFSERFFEQYDEEIAHGMKLLRYLLGHKAPAELQEIRRPPQDWQSAEQIIQAAREHETYVTGLINALVAQAEQDRDDETHSFLQWYVDEQVEEEESMEELLDLVKSAGPAGLAAAEQQLAAMMSKDE